MAAQGGLPKFVVKEFEEYLGCGRLDRGCLRLVCRDCGYSELVAFSCKKRGFCPSCIGRRMADVAVHLEERVLPRVPIRHWICSLPWGLRALLGYDRKLCSEVVSAFMKEVDRSLRWRAKREHGLTSMSQAFTGAVVAVQRTDSALRLNAHEDGDARSPLEFLELEAPTHEDIADVASRTAARVEKILRAHGRSLDPTLADDPGESQKWDETPPDLTAEDPTLAACYAAAAQGVGVSGDRAGLPPLRLITALPDRPRARDVMDAPIAAHLHKRHQQQRAQRRVASVHVTWPVDVLDLYGPTPVSA
jgi:hypothetical protein